MSYIYEALKRAEDENERRVFTPRTAGGPTFLAARPRWWLWALVGVLGANAVLLVTLVVVRGSRSSGVTAPTSSSPEMAVALVPPSRGADVARVPVPAPGASAPAPPAVIPAPSAVSPLAPAATPTSSVAPPAPPVSLSAPPALPPPPVAPPRGADVARVTTPAPAAVTPPPPAVSAPATPVAPTPPSPPVLHVVPTVSSPLPSAVPMAPPRGADAAPAVAVTPPPVAPAPPAMAPAAPLAPRLAERPAPPVPSPLPQVETPRAPTPSTRASDGEGARQTTPPRGGSTAVEARVPASAAAAPPAVDAPKLRVQVVVYSDVPAERLVFIDGRRYAEGDRVDAETVVERITSDGAVVARRGQRFVLTSGRP